MICIICITCFTVALVLLIWYPKRKSLKDDVILVTGAGSGIGRLLCIELSKHCEKVIGWDINESGLEKTAVMVKAETGVIMKCQKCDVGNPEEINDRAAELLSEFGRVTILVNNAGIVIGNYLMQLSKEKFDKIMRVNLSAPFHTTQAFLPGMLGSAYEKAMMSIPKALRILPSEKQPSPGVNQNSPRGHLVFMTSVAGVVTGPGLGDYSMTKSGLIMLANSLRLEMGRMGVGDRIAVTDIRPYFIDTGMFRGHTTNIPYIFPTLRPEKVVSRTVEAILREEKIVYIPWHAWILPVFVHLCPYWLLRILLKVTGVMKGMDYFQHADLTP